MDFTGSEKFLEWLKQSHKLSKAELLATWTENLPAFVKERVDISPDFYYDFMCPHEYLNRRIPKLPPYLAGCRAVKKVFGYSNKESFYTSIMAAAYLQLPKSDWPKDYPKLPRSPSFIKCWENRWDKCSRLDWRPIVEKKEASLAEIDEFEEDNPRYHVLVLGFEEEWGRIYPLRTSRVVGKDKVPLILLYYKDHYYPIESLRKLLPRNPLRFYCYSCLDYFNTAPKLEAHYEDCPAKGVLEYATTQQGRERFTSSHYLPQTGKFRKADIFPRMHLRLGAVEFYLISFLRSTNPAALTEETEQIINDGMNRLRNILENVWVEEAIAKKREQEKGGVVTPMFDKRQKIF